MSVDDTCWNVDPHAGFVLQPDPIADLRHVDTGLDRDTVEAIQHLADTLPTMIADGTLRPTVDDAAQFAMQPAIDHGDGRVLERLLQIYSHLANGYVWCEEQNPMSRIPACVAVPLVELADALGRPPIMAYASTSLANFQRIDPNGGLVADNLRCVQKMIDTQDETWFHVIHVEIEAHAGPAIAHCRAASTAASAGDYDTVLHELGQVPEALDRMVATFRRMTEKCRPEFYFKTLRPYLFGFTDVVYEGVEKFGGEPQTFAGETGAQSTAIPALRALLGLEHHEGGLTTYLTEMVDHMPVPHREFLASIDTTALRSSVIAQNTPELNSAYNACLESTLEFRSLHLNMARSYIASRMENPTGTGGTDFMHWLTLLRDETAEQMI